MRLVIKFLVYLPILLGLSMVFSIPVGIIFTHPQYDGMEALGMVGNWVDYFYGGTKLSYMFLMWPLGILLGIPTIISFIIPSLIILLKIKYGFFSADQLYSSVLGIVTTILILFYRRRGSLQWYFRQDNYLPNYVINFSIFAWTISLTYFLAYYTGHYILVHLGDYFTNTSGGFIEFPRELLEFISGIPITYGVLAPILFGIFSKEKNWNSHIFYLLPGLLFSLLGGPILLFWTVISYIFGIGILKTISIVFLNKEKENQDPI